jgi:SAM-dependent MidA family methyltransferase
LGKTGKTGMSSTPRPLANNEVYGALELPESLHARATETFPTFEAFMDAALHAPTWGYYAQSVTIGRTGHFNTNPEEQSPHYGTWMATWAYRFWRDLVARGELLETEAFLVVEFGAGNGRLARDILDAVARHAGDATAGDGKARLPKASSSTSEPLDTDGWRTFASRLDYRIYETSEGLRDKQRQLLGARARVAAGDARHPSETLARDFPGGVKGLVLTNEVPDAFGVHKVVLTAEGRALAALVVPRVEASVRAAVGEELATGIADANARVRSSFGWTENAGDFYLDAETYAALRERLARLPAEQRAGLLDALWFEETYVPAATIAELGAHLRTNAAQYALALAAEESGVVTYVNLHADRFIRELGTSLTAGFIVTIDYGDTTFRLVKGARRGDFPFRVYGDWSQDHIPRPNDPYTAPGMQDMTTDVNFTDLARAGETAGLHLLHYGPERDVTGDRLPDLLHGSAEESSLAEFVGNPVFKVLVLGTHASHVFTGPLLSPLPLWAREQDIPTARRAKIAAIEKTLAGLGPLGAPSAQ